MEVKLKAVNIAPTVTTDVFFEDSAKWTVTQTGTSIYNTGSFKNNDLNLQIGRFGALPGNTVTVKNNGVVLDTTKEYLMFIKMNVSANYKGVFKVGGFEFKNLPTGKEVVRRFKPTSTELKFELLQKYAESNVLTKALKDRLVIDYCRIVEYDVLYLDLYTTEPILYQSNVKDIYEPDKIKSDYAKSFDLPGSKANNQFFSHWYRVSARGDFDQNVKIPVVIQKNELDILEGYMVLNEVTINGSDVKYNVSVIAEMANIWNDIETLKLKDLDLSKYNHSIDMKKLYVDLPDAGTIAVPPSTDLSLVNTVYTFEASKDGQSTLLTMPNKTIRTKITIANHGYSEGDFVRLNTVFYPAVGSGYFPVPSMSIDCIVEGVFDANTFYVNCNFDAPTSAHFVRTIVKKINFTGDGWFYGFINRGHTTKNIALPTKSRPQLFLKGIFDKIFKESGYQYTSEFLNTNYFKSLCADLVTKEITQLSDDLGTNYVEAKQTYNELNYMVNSLVGPPVLDSKHFLKTAYFGPQTNDVCGYSKRQAFKSYSIIPYGTTFETDLEWGTELTDPQNLYSNGVFTPKLNGDYRMQAFITVGCSILNNAPMGQVILPQKQTFKETSHWYGIDNDLDGTPASTNLWVYNTKERDGNSGMMFWLEIIDITDNKSIWKSVEYLATPSVRGVSKYDYNDCFVDINQTAALPLKKNHSYKWVLKYTRNQKLLLGPEGSTGSKWRWGVSQVEYNVFCNPSFYTQKSAPSSFGNDSWSIFIVGNNQTTDKRTSGNSPAKVTGYNYVKFELMQAVAEGSDIYIRHFIADMTQSEFLTSINKMFNLHWAWDRNNKRYIIEPFYNFYKQDELDWTIKVNTKDEIKLEPLDNSKQYTLKYKDSNDYYNKDYRDAFNVTYGESVVINSSEVANAETKIESGFSLGVLVQYPIDPVNTMIMPTYTTQNIGNGTVTDSNSSDGVYVYICGGKKYTKTPMTLDDGAANVTAVWEGTKFNFFPFVGHVDSTYAPYYDICFANPAQFSYIMKNYTTHNLYNKFWRDWFNLILNRDQKKVTYRINLTDTDIFNLDYSKRYIINKEPFRLVSISDHNLTANNIATAVFIKDVSSKVFKPKTISNGGGNNPWDVDNESIDWTENEWSLNHYEFPGSVEFQPGGGQYNAISAYQAKNSWADSGSSISNAETQTFKNKNFGNSTQFDSISMGTNNFDNGGDNFVSGDSNRIYGRGNVVSGMNNEVSTRNAIVMGDNIRANMPGIYFQDIFIDPDGVIHNATNVFNGGQGETVNYYESVNNLYKPNVLGRISGTSSPTNPFGGVLEVDNPYIDFTRVLGYDNRHDEIRNY